MKYFKFSIIIVFLLIILIVPSVTLASWWNPLSWNIFSIFSKPQSSITNSCPSACKPICGMNGKTYCNVCVANKDNVYAYHEGACNANTNQAGTQQQITPVQQPATSSTSIQTKIQNPSQTSTSSTQPSIIITSPSGKETWQIGSTQTIKWITNNIPSTTEMYVTFVDKGGANYAQNTVINKGSLTITVPPILISGGQYKIKVLTEDNKYFGLSNDYFTIVSSTPQPSITVTSTFGNNTLVRGNTYNITWTASGFATSDMVSIKLYGPYTPSSDNPSSIVLTKNLPVNSGSYSWNISSDITPGDYSVQVYGITGDNNWLASGNSKIFTVTTSSIKPTITITGPNGGAYTDGTQMTITWNITGGNASDYKNYQILLKSNPAQIYGSTPQSNEYFVRLAPVGGDFGYTSNGLNYPSFSVQLPSATKCTMPGVGGSDCSMIKSGTYYIEISVSASASNADAANSLIATSNAFNISSLSQSQPSITITSPNGGETWTQGSTDNITWQARGFSSNAQLYAKLLDYSGLNQGLTINNIPASAGSYSWTVPTNLSGNKFKFDLYQTNNAAIYSISDNYFSIVAP